MTNYEPPVFYLKVNIAFAFSFRTLQKWVYIGEAMSYGAGIVCTKVASTNLGLTENYHNFEDAIGCGTFLMSLSELQEREKFVKLTEITEESKRKYEQFVKTYNKEKLTAELLRGVE